MSEMTFWYHLPVKEGVQHTMECAEKAERIGFDVASHMDHFLYLSKDRGCIPECWTMLTAVAARTGLTVSPMVMCSLFRNPALVAKMVATLDQLTRGRVYLGLGAGWWKEEFEAYGYRWPPPGNRVSRTIEAVQIIRRLWTGEKVDFEGRFWSLKDCTLSPKPHTDPHPLLWNGGAGRRMLKMAGELCDGWLTGGADPKAFSKARERVTGYAKGREMLFGHYLTIEEGKCSFRQAQERIEDMYSAGVTHFQIILRPDAQNTQMLEECRDLIGGFK